MRNEFTLARIVVFALLIIGLAVVATMGAAGQNSTPPDYYNTTDTPENESWMGDDDNATIDSTIRYATRVGTFVVGDEQGETTGSLLMSLVMGAMVVGLVGTSTIGFVAGAVVAVLALGLLAPIGLAPEWIYGVTLYLMGLLLTTVLIRRLR